MKFDLSAARKTERIRSYVSPTALNMWNQSVQAADNNDERSISILDVIGDDFWGGVSARRISGALRKMGSGPVTVNINSPGGDMFEGLAIYNMLKEHDGEVTVKVLSLAASAASIIAMAGDTVQVAKAGFLMIHNAWVLGIGNRHDLRDIADMLEPFDTAMAGVYEDHTGLSEDDIRTMMDKETWINGKDAIDKGFADSLLPSDRVDNSNARAESPAVRKIENMLKVAGATRAEARDLLHQYKSSMQDAAGSDEREAVERNERDAVSYRETAAIAASLTNVFEGGR